MNHAHTNLIPLVLALGLLLAMASGPLVATLVNR